MRMDAGCCSSMRHLADPQLCRCRSPRRSFLTCGASESTQNAGVRIVLDHPKWAVESGEMYLKEIVSRLEREKNIEFARSFYSGARHDQC
jgi:hypothetical protein